MYVSVLNECTSHVYLTSKESEEVISPSELLVVINCPGSLQEQQVLLTLPTLFLTYVYSSFVCVSVYAQHACLVLVEVKKASDPLRLEL